MTLYVNIMVNNYTFIDIKLPNSIIQNVFMLFYANFKKIANNFTKVFL